MTATDTAPVQLDGLREHLNAYSLAAAEIEKWKGIQAQARAAIETALGENEVGTIDGQRAVTWTHSERTTIDTKRLQAELPAEVLAPYTRTTVVRTFKPVAAGAQR
jgi:predicted phage-related endonuclease